jgi:large subunit ribosomal protein L10
MRQDKHLLLDEITESMNKFESFFVMRYEGLKANIANSFRREVLKQGGDVHVMRKRLLLKAAEAFGVTLDNVPLDGHIGVVFADEDPVTMLKSLIQFSKENGEAVKLVGGYAEKQVFDAQQVARLAELPSKPEMQAQLLGTLEAPLSQTLAVMDALVASAVYCLDNYISKQQADDTADAASS